MTKQRLAEIAGWYGILAILAAYGLVSLGVLTADHSVYQLLNLTGALGVIIVSVARKVTQTLVLNIAWVLIAVVGLVRSLS